MKISKHDIGDRLRKLRSDCGRTQKQVAADIGIRLSRYGSYEENRAQPSLATLYNFVAYYGFNSLEELLGIDPKKIKEVHEAKRNKVLLRYNSISAEKRKIIDFILGI